MQNAVIGWTKSVNVGGEVMIEVDMRSEKKEERRIRFIVDGQVERMSIVGIPSSIRFGV